MIANVFLYFFSDTLTSILPAVTLQYFYLYIYLLVYSLFSTGHFPCPPDEVKDHIKDPCSCLCD